MNATISTVTAMSKGALRLEHLHDLLQQFPVDLLRVDRNDLHALFGKRQAAINTLAGANPAYRAQPAVFPLPGHDIDIAFMRAGDTLATGTHQGAKHFNRVDAIVIKTRVKIVQRGRAISHGAENSSMLRLGQEPYQIGA